MTSSCWKKTSPGPSCGPAGRSSSSARRRRRAASRTSAQSAALACTTKLRVNRPRARASGGHAGRLASGSSGAAVSPRQFGGRRRAGPAEPGPDHPALLARPGRVFHVRDGPREPAAQHGQQLRRLAARPAVHRGQQGHLGLGPVAAERAGQRLVQVAGRRPPRRTRDHRPARPAPGARAGPRRPRPAPSPGRRPPRGAAPGGSAARRRPGSPSARTPPRRPRTPGGTGRRTPTSSQPGPAVRGVQPGQFLVLQQQRHRRMIDVAQHPGPGGRDPDPVGRERLEQLGRGVRVHRPAAERRRDLRWPARPAGAAGSPAGGRAAEQAGQQRVVHVGPPGHAAGLHLGGDQAARRLHRGQQAEAARMRVGRDPAQLAGVRGHQLVQRGAGLTQAGLGWPEQGGLLTRCQPPWPGRGPVGGHRHRLAGHDGGRRAQRPGCGGGAASVPCSLPPQR